MKTPLIIKIIGFQDAQHICLQTNHNKTSNQPHLSSTTATQIRKTVGISEVRHELGQRKIKSFLGDFNGQ